MILLLLIFRGYFKVRGLLLYWSAVSGDMGSGKMGMSEKSEKSEKLEKLEKNLHFPLVFFILINNRGKNFVEYRLQL